MDDRPQYRHDPPMPDAERITDQKAALRQQALARRDLLSGDERRDAAETVAVRPFPIAITPGAIVSGFSPFRTEINPLPLMRMLAGAGAGLALPAIAGRGKPLMMRRYAFGDPLVAGQWGIREPAAEASEVIPDVMLVPLAAFDRHGHRIGYGAGYYDLTIAHARSCKPVTAIGIAFAVQEIERVPATPRDARLDLLLTERETIDFRNV